MPDFSPNFTGLDLDNINWYDTYEAMAQTPDEAIMRVSFSTTYLSYKGRNPHKRTSWKLVGNPGHELVAN